MTCPICGFGGKFRPYRNRPRARCPQCRSLERHRKQFLIAKSHGLVPPPEGWSILHCAPEACVTRFLKSLGRVTLGMNQPGVDVDGDLRSLTFPDDHFDLVWASHVLEHILEIKQAVREIHRVMKPGGWAILDVPMSGTPTIRVQPTPRNHFHFWQPGPDWVHHYTDAGLVVVEQVGGITVCRKEPQPSEP